jgi:hypothetical protein
LTLEEAKQCLERLAFEAEKYRVTSDRVVTHLSALVARKETEVISLRKQVRNLERRVGTLEKVLDEKEIPLPDWEGGDERDKAVPP